jgi:hypothetical protein
VIAHGTHSTQLPTALENTSSAALSI